VTPPRAGRGRDGGDLPPDVQVEHWRSATFGERYSIVHEGKTVLTFGSEIEARQRAKAYGWVVTRTYEEGEA
jgi:tRNA U34 5-methylaminomethyl-2-thiouridine-forming methyltransferase MnmC